jgi:hypothetical protein
VAGRADLLDRFDRRFDVFTRAVIFFSESLWSLRSAESKYLIDRGDFFAAFSRTAVLLFTVPRVIAANRVPGLERRQRP